MRLSSVGITAVFGLGNPGERYADTRHNVGVWMVDRIAGAANWKLMSKLSVAAATCSASGLKLFKPTTFMNASGQAVGAASRYFDIAPERCLIIHDELDLPPGRVKLKQGGGHGGHNGLRDIDRHLETKNYWRLRIGIGHPGHKDRVSGYVLSRPNRADFDLIDACVDRCIAVLPALQAGNFDAATQELHTD